MKQIKDLQEPSETSKEKEISTTTEKDGGVSPFDKQIGGTHYKNLPIQPVEFIMKNNLGFCEGCIIKYICRYKYKNGIEDLKKARHYIDMLIESWG